MAIISFYSIDRKSNGEYYFRFDASNSETIIIGEGYNSKQGCLNGIHTVRQICSQDSRYRIKNSPGNYRFNIHALNGEIVASSSEGYSTSHARDHAIELIKREGPHAPIYEFV